MKTSDQYIATIIALVAEYGENLNAVIQKDTLINMPGEGHVEYTTQPDGSLIITVLEEGLDGPEETLGEV